MNIPLNLLFDNTQYSNYLFSGFSHIDKTKITKITYKRVIRTITYKKYNLDFDFYSSVETGEKYNQFEFKIYVNYSFEPIVISCVDSRERDLNSSQSYRWIPSSSTQTNNNILINFITNGSTNNYENILRYLGYILGHIVNNNILLLGDKILNYDGCPITLTKYDSSDNIILLYPCFHTVSNMAYSTGSVLNCPICRSNIKHIQILTFEEFRNLLTT